MSMSGIARNRKKNLFGTTALSVFFALAPAAIAALPEPQASGDGEAGAIQSLEPQGLCIGFDPVSKTWGDKEAGSGSGLCPPDHMIVSAASVGALRWDSPDRVIIFSTCCPLPKGILIADETYAPERCPEETVATGTIALQSDALTEDTRLKILLRCTHIDSSRFELGPPEPGLRITLFQERIGKFTTMFTSWYGRKRFTPKMNWLEIPVAARYGVGRRGRNKWSDEVVAGSPFGAGLSARLGKFPSDFLFRQIRFRRKNSNETPTAVPLFPSCRAIDDPFSPDARCVP